MESKREIIASLTDPAGEAKQEKGMFSACNTTLFVFYRGFDIHTVPCTTYKQLIMWSNFYVRPINGTIAVFSLHEYLLENIVN